MDKAKSALENLKNSMKGYVTGTIESFKTYPDYLNGYIIERKEVNDCVKEIDNVLEYIKTKKEVKF